MNEIVKKKKHRQAEGKAILVDMRKYLHFGKSRTGAKSSAEIEEILQLPLGFSTDKSKNQSKKFEKEYESQIQALKSQVLANHYLNQWQVVGFFLGDGGVHVVWGSQTITTTLGFTGDSRSIIALEIYTASLIRDVSKSLAKLEK